MSLRYSVAVALLDGAALIMQFAHAWIEPDDVWIGMPVRVLFGQAEDVWLPLFKPVSETSVPSVTLTGGPLW